MGFGVGGNLPIDGSLFLEFVTKDAQSQLVMLSLFWPIGQVITSVYSWILIPLFPGCTPPTTQCSPSLTHGWRYVIFAAGITTFFMFFLRFFVFQMLESPKYLLGRGRRDEAIRVLRKLAAENHSGSTTPIDFSPAEFENLLNSLPMVVVKSPLLNLDFSKKLYEFNKSFKPLFTRNIRRYNMSTRGYS